MEDSRGGGRPGRSPPPPSIGPISNTQTSAWCLDEWFVQQHLALRTARSPTRRATASLSASLRRQIRERKSRQDGPSDAQIAQAFDLGFRHPAWPEDLTPAYRLRISVVIAVRAAPPARCAAGTLTWSCTDRPPVHALPPQGAARVGFLRADSWSIINRGKHRNRRGHARNMPQMYILCWRAQGKSVPTLLVFTLNLFWRLQIINCLAELMSGLQAEHAILDGLSRLPRR